jgi:flagellar protein FliO/FliZ
MSLSRKLHRAAAALILALFPVATLAAQTSQTAPQLPPSPLSLGGLLQVLLGLAIVLAAVAGTAWLLRRFGPGQSGAGGVARIVGGLMVGPKERLVVVEIEDNWLVLGVAPGQVNTLYTMAKPEGAALSAGDSAGGGRGFQDWLKQAVRGRRDA